MSIKRSVFRKYYLIILLVSLVFLLSACFQQSTIPQAKPAQQPNVFDQYISVQAIEPDLAGLESNLFQNGDFEDAIGWIPCESASDFSIIEDEDRKSRVLQTNTEGCFYQSVAVQDLDKVNLSCFAKAPSGDLWTGMGLSFSDSSWNAVGEEVSKVFTDASSYNSKSIISDVPNNAEYASMWFYSDGKARVDDCVLKDVPNTTTPINQQSCVVNNNSTWKSILYLPTFGNGEENSDYVAENINLVQNNDGTATLKGIVKFIDDPNRRFEVDIKLSGRTRTSPNGDSTQGWIYYPKYEGRLIGKNTYADKVVTLKSETSYVGQIGDGANKQNQEFGGHFEMSASYGGNDIYLEWAMALDCEDNSSTGNPNPFTGDLNLTGIVFEDSRRDQDYFSGARAFNNVSVVLYSDVNSNSELDNDDLPLATVLTNAEGKYEFRNLIAGSYLVEVTDTNNVLTEFATTRQQPVAVALTESSSADFGYIKLSSNVPTSTNFNEFPIVPSEFGTRSGKYTLNGNTLFVAGYKEFSPDQDRIFVFKRTNQGWKYNATILRVSGTTNESRRYNNFTELIASDNILVATDSQRDAYIFELKNNRWIQTAKFVDAGSNPLIMGDVVVVKNSDDLNVYKKVDGIWVFQLRTYISGEQDRPASIATDGQSLFLPYRSKILQYAIAANGSLQLEATIQIGNTIQNNQIRGIAVTANTLALKDYLYDDNGRIRDEVVRVFSKVNGQWQLQTTLSIPDPIAGDNNRQPGFGNSIDIRNNQILIGAPRASTVAVPDRENPELYTPSYGQGALYLYEKRNGTWNFKKKLHPKDGQVGNNIYLSEFEALTGPGVSRDPLYVFPIKEVNNLPAPTTPLPLVEGSISGQLYVDRNQNNQKDRDEEALTDVTVSLYRDADSNGVFNGDALIETSVTDSLGRYSFNAVNADDYVVHVAPATAPANGVRNENLRYFEISSPSYPAYSIALTTGQNKEGINFAYKNRVAADSINLGDRVWLDSNGNGIQEKGEAGVDGIEVGLYRTDGTRAATSTTTRGGRYFFNPPAGSYYIQVNLNPRNERSPTYRNFTRANADANDVLDSDVIPPTANGGNVYIGKTDVFNIVEGQTNLDIDIGIYRYSPSPERLNVFVWKDVSGNGLRDELEPSLQDISVDLIDDESGQVILSKRTDSSGSITFAQRYGTNADDLSLRTDKAYKLRFTIPDGLQPSPIPNDGEASQTANDLAPNQREIGPFYLTLGNSTENSFAVGLYSSTKTLGKIAGQVWRDSNGNGIQDSGESGVSDIELTIRFAGEYSRRTIRSDSNGNYSFGNLAADEYTLSANIPRNYLLSPAEQIADESLDSDLSSQFRSVNVTLGDGELINNIDVGLRPLQKLFEQQKITATGRNASYVLGQENTIVTTSYNSQYDSETRQTTYESFVEVFVKNNNAWTRTKLWELPYRLLDFDISADGKTIAVAYKTNVQTPADQALGILTYKLSNSTWSQASNLSNITDGYTNPGSINLDESGQNLILSRQLSYNAPETTRPSGIDVYKRNGDSWQLQKTLNPWVDAGFGNSTRAPQFSGVDISQGQLVVSVIERLNIRAGEGKVVIYGQNVSGGDQWGVQQVLGPQSRFTSSLSIYQNNLVLVGSSDLYLYTKNSSGRWELSKTEENVVSPYSGLSSGVSIFGKTFLYTKYSSGRRGATTSIPIVNTINAGRDSWQSIGLLERNDTNTTRPNVLFYNPQVSCKYIAATKSYSSNEVSIFANPNSSSCN